MAENKLHLEHYADGGVSLTTPVAVRELLMQISGVDLSKASVRIESEKSSGWIWLVYSRSIYIWNFKERVVNCYELSLPSSGLIHSSCLCHVWVRSDNDASKPPSCLYASPEGLVRYWPKISHPSVFVDKTVELSGQVGHSVTPLKGKLSYPAVVLSTTTCGLFLLTIPDERSSRNAAIQCVPLKSTQNLVSGISRRISSFIFSSGFSSQDALVNASVSTKKGVPNVNLLYLLNIKYQLQCWQLDLSSNNKVLWAIDLLQSTMEKLAYEIWHLKGTDLHLHPGMRMWPVDFIVTARRRLGILTAIHDPAMSPVIHYLVVFYAERDHGLVECVDIIRLPFTKNHEPHLDESGLDQLNLLCPFSYDGFVVHSDSFLAMLEHDKRNVYNLRLPGKDQILGAGIHGDQVLVFTLENGLQVARIRSEKTDLPYVTDYANQRLQLHHLTKSEEELEELAQDGDRGKQFKAAFLYFLNRKLAECEAILEELFCGPLDDLDELAVSLGRDLVDDYPAADPRWMNEFSRQCDQEEGVTTRRKAKSRRTEGGSLLLIYQLDDKRKTMELFLSYLKVMRLTEKMHNYTVPGGTRVPTLAVLCETGEKLEACAAFVRKVDSGSKYDLIGKICNEAIGKILEQREEKIGDTLSVRDVFYRKVSSFHDILPVFVDLVLTTADQSRNQDDTNLAVDLVSRGGDCLLAVLTSSSKYRHSLEQQMNWRHPTDRQTWLNNQIIRTALANYCIHASGFIPDTIDPPVSDLLTKLCRDMADYILSECAIAPDRRIFGKELRRGLISPLVSADRYEPALFLSEKYRDFGLLIEICEKLGDDQLLDTYKTNYQKEGFLEYFYDYCIAQKKPGRILQAEGMVPTSEVAKETWRYLESRRRSDLKWIFNARMNDFEKAGVELLKLANAEDESLDKKKTYLSLAKLAALTNDSKESGCLKEAEEGLVLVEHQKRLHPVANNAPLTAEELIDAYISDPTADEWSFAKAVDIMTSICVNKMPRSDYKSLRSHLWASAILKDDWKQVLANTEDLLSAASDTVFSRTIQLLCTLYKDDRQRIVDYLSSANELLECPELEMLVVDPKLEFVLKAGEEQIRVWMKDEDNERKGNNDSSMFVDCTDENTA